MASIRVLFLLGAVLVRAGSLEHLLRGPHSPSPALPGCGVAHMHVAPRCELAQRRRHEDCVAALLDLRLRGGGARNKWRRKQNQNRASGGGYGSNQGAGGGGGNTAGKRVGKSEGTNSPAGLAGLAGLFQTRWQNFPRNAGAQRRDTREEEESMSSEVMYVDSQGNEVPAR